MSHDSNADDDDDSCACRSKLILEQQFLISNAGEVAQQAGPFVVCHEEHPS
jgi:hypothetical protein